VCHAPSFRGVGPEFTDLDSRVPFAVYPRNRHEITPFGICHLNCPPGVADCPFWIMLPKLRVVRNRIVIAKSPVPGFNLESSTVTNRSGFGGGSFGRTNGQR
jgi:hypothetical protein